MSQRTSNNSLPSLTQPASIRRLHFFAGLMQGFLVGLGFRVSEFTVWD